jgi:hypothetical protein
MRALLLGPLLLLAACESEPENIQAKADNMARSLEQDYRKIEAEAENRADAAVAPLENEADALLSNLAPTDNAADANLATSNAQ